MARLRPGGVGLQHGAPPGRGAQAGACAGLCRIPHTSGGSKEVFERYDGVKEKYSVSWEEYQAVLHACGYNLGHVLEQAVRREGCFQADPGHQQQRHVSVPAPLRTRPLPQPTASSLVVDFFFFCTSTFWLHRSLSRRGRSGVGAGSVLSGCWCF